MKVEISLYETSEEVKPKYEYVHSFFHTSEITGLDICVRKQLVVTCSKDKTIKVWNYSTKQLEISATTTEDALAVSFHPSGFHLIVALLDKINIFNVLSKTLNMYKSLVIKQCKEVRFCNGGHLFAAAQSSSI
jgi:WD40 repeat protein